MSQGLGAAFDTADIATRWRHEAADPRPHAGWSWLPAGECARTPAARRIVDLAAQAGLFAFHFEHRAHLPLPEAWVPPGRDDLSPPPAWVDGVLPERKVQSFRHDLLIASHHPGHRAKWGVHELCHGLVGFAWRPDASALWHATAGRLAELLPVALWYGFDEAFLRRCDRHQGQGALFTLHCDRCEAVAAPFAEAEDAEARIAWGLDFVARELAAVDRTRRTGVVHPHRFATLELASDGVAYAAAHLDRLTSPAFASFAERFLVPGQDVSPTLDDLTERVLDVLSALTLGSSPRPMAPSPDQGRARWMLQDVGWRLITAAVLDPSLSAPLAPWIDALAGIVPDTAVAGGRPEERLRAVLADLNGVLAGLDAPWASALVQVGYRLPGVPYAADGLSEGLADALPLVWEAVEDGRDALIDAFVHADDGTRAPLARRFAAWLGRMHPGPLADLARWEAEARHLAPATTPLVAPAADARRVLTPGWVALRFDRDVLALAEAVEQGAIGFSGPAMVVHDGEAPPSEPTGLLLGRDPSDEIVLLDVDPATVDALEALGPDGDIPRLPDDELEALEAHGALRPVAHAFLLHPDDPPAVWWPSHRTTSEGDP